MQLCHDLVLLLIGLLREVAYLVAVWAVAIAVVWAIVFGLMHA